MQQTQISFHDENVPKQTGAATSDFAQKRRGEYRKGSAGGATLLLIRIGSARSGGAIRYFDFVAPGSEAEIITAEDAKKIDKETPTVGGRNEQSRSQTCETFFTTSVFTRRGFQSKKYGQARETFIAMLVNLDRILNLDEFSERLEKMDAAARFGDCPTLRSIARECFEIGNCCGMTAALEPLGYLKIVNDDFPSADAAVLIERVRNAYENLRSTVRRNLEGLRRRKIAQP